MTQTKTMTTSIGMKQGSGHRVCGYKLLFATMLWSAFCGQIGLPIVSGIMVNTFRADGNLFGTLQLIAGFLALLFAALAGYLQDVGMYSVCFDKWGCPRKTWGRRAPPMLLYIPLMSIPLFFVWLPPNWALTATETAATAKYPSSDFTFPAEGVDCSVPVALTLINGARMSFNETLPTNKLSKDLTLYNGTTTICEAVVSINSFCWPVSDTVRKCSYSDPVVAYWWFFCFVVGMWCFENINAAYKAGSIEIYPWKEERLQLTSLGVIIAILGVSVPVVTSGIVQNNSEFGASPFGGNQARMVASVVSCVCVYFGLASYLPLKDARQPSRDKPTFFVWEWIDLLKHHDAMRWNFINVIFNQIWQGLQSAMILYYLNIVALVPTAEAGTGYILTVIVGLFTRIVAAVVLGFVFGSTNPKGRELSRNPRTAQLVGCLLCIVASFVTILIDPPTPRNETGSYTGILLNYALANVFHSPYDYWWNSMRGWQIDEDCHRSGVGKKRREGVIVGLLNFGIAIGSTIGVIVVSVVLVGADPICDTRLAANQMSETCVDFIWYTFLLGLPLLKAINLVVVLMHPIKGERLTQLYYTQGDHHQVIDGGNKNNVNVTTLLPGTITIVSSPSLVAVGDRVNTTMGRGTVVSMQSNGDVTVLQLDWTLANNGKAMMFCQTSNLL